MDSIKKKLGYEQDELHFIKSIMKLNILVDLLSKELCDSYPAIKPSYKENLKGIAKSFEKFKVQVNSTCTLNYNTLNEGQQMAMFELNEEIEKIINNIIDEVYEC